MTPIEARRLLAAAPVRPVQQSVLLCSPVGYRIAYAINPHMTDAEGRLKRVNSERAKQQWEGLAAEYRSLGVQVELITGEPAFPDMVFAANQTLPFKHQSGKNLVLLSNMYAEERRGEIDRFEAWFKSKGYDIRRLSVEEAGTFEGHGDFIWHPTRRLLFGGWGFRTSEDAHRVIARLCAIPIVSMRLVDPRFYHLDTCLMPLDDRCALIFKPAFDAESVALVAACFETLIEPPEDEAVSFLACNAHSVDGKNVLIDSSCEQTAEMLEALGFVPHRLDTSEFLKAGGSVFCMKQMLA
jgi:N-dimethylarginine dimethylaminohydrolase